MIMNTRRIPNIDALPEFDPHKPCPKCGFTVVNARYRVDNTFPGARVEWICRQCERCHYLWDERCLTTDWNDDDDNDDEDDA